MKKRYSINDVAKLFSITTNKLRFYEKKGLLAYQRDASSNYRYYHNEDIKKIQIILTYRVLGFSISDIKDILAKDDKESHLDHFYNHWKAINDKIDKLQLLRNSMEGLIDSMYSSDESNSCELLIQSITNLNELTKTKDSWIDRWDFNSWAKNYDKSVYHGKGVLNMYQHYEEILEKVFTLSTENLNSDGWVLDLGVGTGNLAQKYLDADYHVYGIDQSREMLNVAKNKFPSLKVRLGEFMKIPFADNSFDAIVSTYSFHHLNQYEKSIAIVEMLRVLKDSGVIVMGDLMFENEQSKQKLFANLTGKQIEFINDEYYSDIEWLANEFKRHNKSLEYIRIDLLNYIITVT